VLCWVSLTEFVRVVWAVGYQLSWMSRYQPETAQLDALPTSGLLVEDWLILSAVYVPSGNTGEARA